MKKIFVFGLLSLLLVACGKPSPTDNTSSSPESERANNNAKSCGRSIDTSSVKAAAISGYSIAKECQLTESEMLSLLER